MLYKIAKKNWSSFCVYGDKSFWSTKGGHFETSPVLPLYSTDLAMVPRLILKSIKIMLYECVSFGESLRRG